MCEFFFLFFFFLFFFLLLFLFFCFGKNELSQKELCNLEAGKMRVQQLIKMQIPDGHCLTPNQPWQIYQGDEIHMGRYNIWIKTPGVASNTRNVDFTGRLTEVTDSLTHPKCSQSADQRPGKMCLWKMRVWRRWRWVCSPPWCPLPLSAAHHLLVHHTAVTANETHNYWERDRQTYRQTQTHAMTERQTDWQL